MTKQLEELSEDELELVAGGMASLSRISPSKDDATEILLVSISQQLHATETAQQLSQIDKHSVISEKQAKLDEAVQKMEEAEQKHGASPAMAAVFNYIGAEISKYQGANAITVGQLQQVVASITEQMSALSALQADGKQPMGQSDQVKLLNDMVGQAMQSLQSGSGQVGAALSKGNEDPGKGKLRG